MNGIKSGWLLSYFYYLNFEVSKVYMTQYYKVNKKLKYLVLYGTPIL